MKSAGAPLHTRGHYGFAAVWLLLALLAVSGCLPSSCSRTESRALFPSDSLSRSIAAEIAVDTLSLLWSSRGPDDAPFEYPRTVLFDGEGNIWVSDAESNRLKRLSNAGNTISDLTDERFSYPYLAGISGDTTFIFSPGRSAVLRILAGSVEEVAETPKTARSGLLQYAQVHRGKIFLKLLGDDFTGYVTDLSDDRTRRVRTELPGPSWRWAGGLRVWGDTLLSLRGYRPVVDLILPDGGRDSLLLRGFDSPMLARSRLFAFGKVTKAPLLTSSAYPFEKRLYVLNMRPGWLRVDVYNRAGQLVHVLTQRDPAFDRSFYPIDLAVRRSAPNTIQIAVAVVEPEPRVDLYSWDEAP